MAYAPLRQPKLSIVKKDTKQTDTKKIIKPLNDLEQVIITMKNNNKLVISSDSYHGIITAGGNYMCVFCDSEMELDPKLKEIHKKTDKHRKALDNFPYAEEYLENLVRKISSNYYCSICNVIVSSLTRHLSSEVHIEELEKALKKTAFYTPISGVAIEK